MKVPSVQTQEALQSITVVTALAAVIIITLLTLIAFLSFMAANWVWFNSPIVNSLPPVIVYQGVCT